MTRSVTLREETGSPIGRAQNSAYLVYGEVAQAVEACLAVGEQPDMEALAARHPDMASQIRQLVPALITLEQLGRAPSESATRSAGEAVAADPNRFGSNDEPAAGRIGEFRIMREIGRGGMGVVYEAIQLSLGRRVALKVLPFPAVMDPKQLQRFKNEAQAAAQLHHQNIVPVYSVGCEHGVHYYTMQFIDGQNLAAMIADLRRFARPNSFTHGEANQDADLSPAEPLASDLLQGKWIPSGSPTASHSAMDRVASDTVRQPEAALSTEDSTKKRAFFQSVAQLAIQAAQALEHSHNLGVVHRDIKPTNL